MVATNTVRTVYNQYVHCTLITPLLLVQETKKKADVQHTIRSSTIKSRCHLSRHSAQIEEAERCISVKLSVENRSKIQWIACTSVLLLLQVRNFLLNLIDDRFHLLVDKVVVMIDLRLIRLVELRNREERNEGEDDKRRSREPSTDVG